MKTSKSRKVSRRDFIKLTGAAAVSATTGWSPIGSKALAKEAGRYNILMIVTDQERYMPPAQMPSGYQLPGHEKLASRGVVFENHQVASCVCTPSRAVIYTGQHIQNNGMFDNTNFPWSDDLSREIPTLGDMLLDLGYYTAYKGKWHLTGEFETANDLHMPTRLLGEEMKEYGFSDYFGIGDIIAHTEGGFLHDSVIASMTKSWLRGQGRRLGAEKKPWFMAVNLVNPHDVMYYNTDLPGGPSKQATPALMALNHDPHTRQFSQQWDLRLPESRKQSMSEPGRPAAHEDYAVSRAALVGQVPNEDERWRRLNNYYLNCVQAVDRHILDILNELDDLGMAENTVVIHTADHGELAGAHGLSGKGATAFREQNNVPFVISHPEFPGSKRCKAVTSHLDIATTLISLAGGNPKKHGQLHGSDMSVLLRNPESASLDAIRPGALFNYNMLAYLDGDFMMNISRFMKGGGKREDIPKQGWRPDLKKRGAIRSVFDGRYKLNRYFSPQEHHVPRTLEELRANNDVELFDLGSDPGEARNLANENRDLLIAMNDKLNALIESEVGEDSGQMMPDDSESSWALDPSIVDVRM
jgi:arylsulfatase